MKLSDESCLMNKPLQINKVIKHRITTDVIYIYIFGVFITLWLIAIIYVLFFKPISYELVDGIDYIYEDINDRNNLVDWLEALINSISFTPNSIIEEYEESNDVTMAWLTFNTILTSLALLYAATYINFPLGFISKLCICFPVLIFGILLVTLIHNIVCEFKLNIRHDDMKLTLFDTLNAVYMSTFYIVSVYCLSKIGITPIAEVIQKACRSLCYFRSLIIFVVLNLSLNTLVTVLSLTIMQYLNTKDALYFITLITIAYVNSFISYFAMIVVSMSVSIWHCRKDNQCSSFTILRSVGIVLRYHLGSIAFGSSYILPLVLAAYVSFKFKCRTSSSIFTKFFGNLFLILNSADYALVQLSIDGRNTYQATKRSFELVAKNYYLTLAASWVFNEIVVVVIWFLAPTLSALLFKMLQVTYDINPLCIWFLEPLINTVCTAQRTILMCTLDTVDDDDEEKASHINLVNL